MDLCAIWIYTKNTLYFTYGDYASLSLGASYCRLFTCKQFLSVKSCILTYWWKLCALCFILQTNCIGGSSHPSLFVWINEVHTTSVLSILISMLKENLHRLWWANRWYPPTNLRDSLGNSFIYDFTISPMYMQVECFGIELNSNARVK